MAEQAAAEMGASAAEDEIAAHAVKAALGVIPPLLFEKALKIPVSERLVL